MKKDAALPPNGQKRKCFYESNADVKMFSQQTLDINKCNDYITK